jgi:hypothetical protein
VNNTLVKNGGGATFLGASRTEAMGNILSFNKVGFLIAPSSQTRVGYNVLFNSDDYMRAGSPNRPAPELKANSDILVDPGFVDAERDDFHLQPDTTLLNVGGFRYLGALPPRRPVSMQ